MASFGSSLNNSAITLPSLFETRSLAGGKSVRWPLMIMNALGSVVGCVAGAAAAGKRAWTGTAASELGAAETLATARDAGAFLLDAERLSQPISAMPNSEIHRSLSQDIMMVRATSARSESIILVWLVSPP